MDSSSNLKRDWDKFDEDIKEPYKRRKKNIKVGKTVGLIAGLLGTLLILLQLIFFTFT